jgi:hypothetical protein
MREFSSKEERIANMEGTLEILKNRFLELTDQAAQDRSITSLGHQGLTGAIEHLNQEIQKLSEEIARVKGEK